MAGFEDVQIVGGLEHMQHIPMDKDIDLNPKLFHRTSKGALNDGHHGRVPGPDARHQPRGAGPVCHAQPSSRRQAQAAGEFKNEIIPVWGHDESWTSHRSHG